MNKISTPKCKNKEVLLKSIKILSETIKDGNGIISKIDI